MFQDPDLKKLAPSKPEVGTYTTNTVKLFGSCVFYLVHLDTKCLLDITFYVASNIGSVLLSCVTMLVLGFINLALDWTIFLLEPALLLVVLTTQRRQVPSECTCIWQRIWSVYSVQLKRYSAQANYQQETDSCSLFRCVWWHRTLTLTPIPYSSWSWYYTQANPMLTSASTSQRAFQARNW